MLRFKYLLVQKCLNQFDLCFPLSQNNYDNESETTEKKINWFEIVQTKENLSHNSRLSLREGG